MDNMQLKICRVCGLEKCIDEFPMEGKYRSGRCKKCRNEHSRKWTKENRAKATEYQRKYRERNPEKYKNSSKKNSKKFNEINKKKTQLKNLTKILLKFSDLKENPFKFKGITEVPISTLTPEQKKERNKIKQMEWRAKNKNKILKSNKNYRDKNKDKINSKKRIQYAIKTGKMTPEQIEFNNELKKALADMGF